MTDQTFFFYDLETTGTNPRSDRIMQFAGQRTNLDFEPIGDPVNVLIKLTDEVLPSPYAIMVTKITPQDTHRDGISEAEFAKIATEEIFTPGTIATGFNSVRFDDEFMRAFFWRNFYDPYEWQWKDGRSRWDLLDVVRLARALRPEGINWPVTEDGRATNRLELLTKLNHLEHKHAHDALSDVYATIAVARLLHDKQPELFRYLFEHRDKNSAKEIVNLENPKPFVYASGRYAGEFNKTTVAFPIAPGRNGNVLVYDLRKNPKDIDPEHLFPTVKELCFNKCPAVAPLGVLNKVDGWSKIGLDLNTVEQNLNNLTSAPERVLDLINSDKRPEFPPPSEPEAALYDGFVGDGDRIKIEAVRNAGVDKLYVFQPDFSDSRLPALLLHYKARNFPDALAKSEAEAWEGYRRARLEKAAPQFLKDLAAVYNKYTYIGEKLKLYFENLSNL